MSLPLIATEYTGRDFLRVTQPDYLGGPLDTRTTKLHIRLRGEGEPAFVSTLLAPIGLFVFEPAHFIMEREMMLGIKRRAERGSVAGT